MNHFTFFRRLALSFGSIFVFSAVAGAGDVSEIEATHDALIETARDKEADYETALAEAEEKGLAAGWILEAELVRGLTTGNVERLFELLPRIESVGDDFRYGIGRNFISELQLKGFAETLRCVQAYREDDMEAFEKYAVSSFEKAPDFNQAFGIADLLTRYRYEQVQQASLADLTVPMDMQLANVEGETRSLQEWLGDDKALLFDFWASWCGPCMRLMPSLKEKSASLSEQGVFVAGVNIDQRDPLENAKKVREQHEMASVPWLLDRNTSDLSSFLQIDSIPRMVLIDRKGKVLYNGHPADPALGVALAKIGVTVAHE